MGFSLRLRASSVRLEGDRAFLEDPCEVSHARACRLKVGERVQLLFEDGRRASCTVVSASRGSLELRIEGFETLKRPYPVLVLMALPSRSALEEAVRTLTELGVRAIGVFRSERSHSSSTGEVRLERLRRIAVEASKQSGNPYLPEVSFLGSLEEAVGLCLGPIACAAPSEGEGEVSPLGRLLAERISRGMPVELIVGPEGGFSGGEISLLRERGVPLARLGRLTLRSPTAAVAASALALGLSEVLG